MKHKFLTIIALALLANQIYANKVFTVQEVIIEYLYKMKMWKPLKVELMKILLRIVDEYNRQRGNKIVSYFL